MGVIFKSNELKNGSLRHEVMGWEHGNKQIWKIQRTLIKNWAEMFWGWHVSIIPQLWWDDKRVSDILHGDNIDDDRVMFQEPILWGSRGIKLQKILLGVG